MTNQEKYAYWLEYAKADLDTADFMAKAGRQLYVTFMCQQAIEKLVNGLYGLYLDFDNIPRIHNITRLINDFAEMLPQSVSREYYDLFNMLSDYYLNSRYPEYVENLSSKTVEGNSIKIVAKSKEVFEWLLTLTPSDKM